MKKTFFTLIILVIATTSFGQKSEFRIAFNSGLFSFTGQSAETTTSINYSDGTASGYTNNPYGAKSGISYGLSGNLKRIAKSNFILGVDFGYEVLRSKVSINKISGWTGTTTYQYTATGKTFLNYGFINLNPFMGYRFQLKGINLDLVGGFDIAYCIATQERGNATATNGTKYETSVERKTIKTDLRPRLQLSGELKNTGLFVGYSAGILNYMSGFVGGVNECYARLVRFGITYRMK